MPAMKRSASTTPLSRGRSSRCSCMRCTALRRESPTSPMPSSISTTSVALLASQVAMCASIASITGANGFCRAMNCSVLNGLAVPYLVGGLGQESRLGHLFDHVELAAHTSPLLDAEGARHFGQLVACLVELGKCRSCIESAGLIASVPVDRVVHRPKLGVDVGNSPHQVPPRFPLALITCHYISNKACNSQGRNKARLV